jgi:hypothetical protein
MIDIASPRGCGNRQGATQSSGRLFIILADRIIWDHSRCLKLSVEISSEREECIFSNLDVIAIF